MEPAPLSMDGFATAFLRHAASPARVAGVVAELLGEQIRFGPLPVGPGNIATAKATGTVRAVRGTPLAADGTAVCVHTEVDLRITVRIAGQLVRFHADLRTTVRIGLRLVRPLTVLIDIHDVGDEDIALDLVMPAMVARAVARIGNVADEVRTHTSRYIHDLAHSERAAALMRIDVAGLVDRAWEQGILLPQRVGEE